MEPYFKKPCERRFSCPVLDSRDASFMKLAEGGRASGFRCGRSSSQIALAIEHASLSETLGTGKHGNIGTLMFYNFDIYRSIENKVMTKRPLYTLPQLWPSLQDHIDGVADLVEERGQG